MRSVNKEFWVALLSLIVAILSGFIILQQLQLQQLDAESRRLQLEYAIYLGFSREDKQSISIAEEKLVADFFVEVPKYIKNHPGTSYLDAIRAVTPMTASVTTKPFSASVRIMNLGKPTATRIRAVIKLDRPITSYDVRSLDNAYSVLKGGIGDSQITIEVDRIVASGAVEIDIASETVGVPEQVDKVVLRRALDTDKLSLYRTGTLDKFSMLGGGSTSWDVALELPSLFYAPGRAPNIDVVVTSDQGYATPYEPPPISVPSDK